MSDRSRDETHVLATASGGAVILIRLEDKKVRFYAHAGVNPHSAEILPDGNIISASSTDSTLRIFSTDASVTSFPDSVYLQDYTLTSAHGVVWDRARTCVWAVGYRTIRRYSYNFDRQKPMLQEEAVFELPEAGGHDLFPTWDANDLMITTHSKIWSFDPVEQTFSPYPLLPEAVRVKSISERNQKPTTVYMQACESWWCVILFVLQGVRKPIREKGLDFIRSAGGFQIISVTKSKDDMDVQAKCTLIAGSCGRWRCGLSTSAERERFRTISYGSGDHF